MRTRGYRKQQLDLFSYFCAICVSQPRFRLPYDIAQHDKSKHGKDPNPFYRNTHGATFPAISAHPRSKSASASPRLLSVVTARELNTFIQTELEPDTEYNENCSAVVDRLCQFMQNSFPDDLKPSGVQKVISPIIKKL